MFGIKELKNDIVDINRKLERILWVLSDKPQSKTKSIIKYKNLKTTVKTIDRLVNVLSERPYTINQIALKMNLKESSVRTYLRDARMEGHKIYRISKRRNRKLISYYTMEV